MSAFLKPVNLFLRIIPDKIHTRLLSQIGRHFMQGQSITERLDIMQGKRVKITITDTGNSWVFVFRDKSIVNDTKSNAEADVHIQGDLNTFLLLATRQEDPDSLFFSRHLKLEGNTEDGLYIKNIIDAMDYDIDIYLKSVLGQTLATRLTPLLKRLELSKQINSLSKHILTYH